MFKRNLVSVSFASVLLSSSLAATANTHKDDEEDSVKSWGQWAKQYATAAGGEINTRALAFASLGQGEAGRNSQNEADVETGYKVEIDNAGERQYVSWGARNGFSSVPTGSKRAEIEVSVDGAEGSYIVASFDDRHDSVLLDRNDRQLGGVGYEEGYFKTHDGLRWSFLTLEDGEGDYQRGYWYTDFNPGSGWVTNAGFFITGMTSTVTAVEGLANDVLAGNVSAVYNGAFLGNRGDVTIEVDFGRNAGWTGSFKPVDFVEFDAKGTFEGVNLVGSINTAGVTGTVDASFFGDNANVIAGIAEANAGEAGDFVGVFETSNLPVDDIVERPAPIDGPI